MELQLRVGRQTAHLRSSDEEVHYAFDKRGRLLSGHHGDDHVQVGLDGTVLARRGRRGARLVGPLPVDAADALFERVAALARGAAVADAIGRALRDTIARRGAAAYREDAAAFQRVYRPVPVLPPDSALALLVQVTEGCSYGGCAFCTLYEGTPFRIKGREELTAHLDAIASLLGAAAVLRRGVFLGDANALLAPHDLLVELLAAVRERFCDAARAGASCFLDTFSGRPPEVGRLGALAAAGLRRVSVGLETGDDALRDRLRKPGSSAQAVEVVRRLKEAGLGVGVIVLLDAGGASGATAHVRDTARAVHAMGLGAGDIVYLSPLVDPPPRVAHLPAGDHPAQEAALRRALGGGARVARYDLRRWVY